MFQKFIINNELEKYVSFVTYFIQNLYNDY